MKQWLHRSVVRSLRTRTYRPLTALGLVALGGALPLTACGESSDDGSTPGSGGSAGQAAAGAAGHSAAGAGGQSAGAGGQTVGGAGATAGGAGEASSMGGAAGIAGFGGAAGDAGTTSGAGGAAGPGNVPPACLPGDQWCDCAAEQTCAEGLHCVEDVCVALPPACGNGTLDPGEECDDGNDLGFDGCEVNCTESVGVKQVATSGSHTCAVLMNGAIRCWGQNTDGQLGYGHTDRVLVPSLAGDVEVGGKVAQVATGSGHTCAVLDSGAVRCWGFGESGRLGYGNTENVGDNETPSSVGDVSIGGKAVHVTAGNTHTCALLEGGSVRCWGFNHDGQLGNDWATGSIGDDELPVVAPVVDIGGDVQQIDAGGFHTCAVLTGNTLRCWGSGTLGRLGYPDVPSNIPAEAGDVPVGAPVVQVAAGAEHTCALTDGESIYCWGNGSDGRLGTGSADFQSTPAGSFFPGAPAVHVDAGRAHTCALLEDGAIRCWGDAGYGQLGYGNTLDLGAGALSPLTVGNVPVGVKATSLAVGGNVTCGVTEHQRLRCWGNGSEGQLGYGNTENVGNARVPWEAGDVPLF